MDRSCISPDSVNHEALIAFALGQYDPGVSAHLVDCAYCRDEVRLYRSLLTSTREALGGHTASVYLVSCQQHSLVAGEDCVADSGELELRITVERFDSSLVGHLSGCSDNCLCWQGATVRLFGATGFVASSPVDEHGLFRLAGVQAGQRYTLGLVLPDETGAQLTIIGDFAVQ